MVGYVLVLTEYLSRRSQNWVRRICYDGVGSPALSLNKTTQFSHFLITKLSYQITKKLCCLLSKIVGDPYPLEIYPIICSKFGSSQECNTGVINNFGCTEGKCTFVLQQEKEISISLSLNLYLSLPSLYVRLPVWMQQWFTNCYRTFKRAFRYSGTEFLFNR